MAQLQREARKFNALLCEPALEQTPAEIQASVSNTVARAGATVALIEKRGPDQATFANTARVLDDLAWEVSCARNRFYLLSATSTNKNLRDAAAEAGDRLPQQNPGGEAAAAALKAIARKNPPLNEEDRRLLNYLLRDYQRAGLDLPRAEREKLTQMRQRLAGLTTAFNRNLVAAQDPVEFTQAELEGVPARVLAEKGVKTGENKYALRPVQLRTVMETACREATRKRAFIAEANRAASRNTAVVQQMLELRSQIARALGYASWADYAIEPRMAGTAAKARRFCERLNQGLQTKFEAELRQLTELKARDTGDTNARINWWDTDYYREQLRREKFNFSSEELRVFFPSERALSGMFSMCERVLGLTITRVAPARPWTDELRLYALADARTGEPLGLVYLDLFARDGKCNDNEEDIVISGKRLSNGSYHRPVALVLFHFPPAQPGRPLLLTHAEVVALFHEFGHALHDVLTWADYATFAGSRVPRDFVEAPSQILERWAWDQVVLDSFAADYRDASKKIPPTVLSRLKAAKLETAALDCRWKAAWALADLALHSQGSEASDSVKLSNQILSEGFLPLPEGVAPVTGFVLLPGYDAACYGYLWAEAIAADMATAFEQSPKGFFDGQAGFRLRREIYETGNSRDVNESVEKFLGRPQSIKPFLKDLGAVEK